MKIPYSIKGRNINLRPLKENDFEGFCSFWQNEKATRHLLFHQEEHKETEYLKKYFAKIINSYDSPEQIFILAITDKQDEYVGMVGLASDFNTSNKQIFWSVLPEYWNNGFASEAVKRLLNYATTKLNQYTIVAYSHPDNLASTRVAIKAGMKSCGTIEIDETEGFVEYFEYKHTL